jgi:ERF superfamily
MHRSSDTIGNISAALAKAQAELTNPEKSLTATIRSPFPRERDRTFRYAPLSSGLDIIRKSLGRHEIATIQSTEIDIEVGLLRLTTILAHSSGEWISSEWPVCTIADIASAQRMGAALTYARRYALFTLVGIAGEDDLDAPDVDAVPNPAADLPRSNGQASATQRTARSDGKLRSVLGEQLSASLRESLIGQMASLNSAEEAAAWARQSLLAKNTLTAADARMVEQRFQARLGAIGYPGAASWPQERSGGAMAGPVSDGTIADPPHAIPDQTAVSAGSAGAATTEKAPDLVGKRSRKTAVPLGKTVRLRDKDHRKFVLRQACLVCGRVPSDPHHLTFTQPRALGRRVSDEFIVPVCRVHHRELHRAGDEAAWWHRLNIDPVPVALKLWQQTRGNGEVSRSSEAVVHAKTAETPEASAQPVASRDRNGHPDSAA